MFCECTADGLISFGNCEMLFCRQPVSGSQLILPCGVELSCGLCRPMSSCGPLHLFVLRSLVFSHYFHFYVLTFPSVASVEFYNVQQYLDSCPRVYCLCPSLFFLYVPVYHALLCFSIELCTNLFF